MTIYNKTPAKAFTPPAKTKMGTRPGRVVIREFIGGGVYSLISLIVHMLKTFIVHMLNKILLS